MGGGAHGVLTLDSKTFARDLYIYVFFSADLYTLVCVCVFYAVVCCDVLCYFLLAEYYAECF